MLWALVITLRYRIHGDEALANPGADRKTFLKPVKGTKGKVVVHWHENVIFFTLLLFKRKPPFTPLASKSKDAEWGVKIVRRLGYEAVRGSSRKGGKEAIVQLMQKLNEGYNILLAVDGPTGPKHVPKPGALKISAACQAEILPTQCFCSNSFALKTWDKMRIPYPFSTVDIVFGPAIQTPENFTIKKDTALIQELAQSIESIKRPGSTRT